MKWNNVKTKTPVNLLAWLEIASERPHQLCREILQLEPAQIGQIQDLRAVGNVASDGQLSLSRLIGENVTPGQHSERDRTAIQNRTRD